MKYEKNISAVTSPQKFSDKMFEKKLNFYEKVSKKNFIILGLLLTVDHATHIHRK